LKDWKFLFEKYVLNKHQAEPQVRKCMKKMRGQLFVDVGSNRKVYTELLRHNFEKVISIDPNPKWNADIKVALSSFNGTAPFQIGNGMGSADGLMQNPHIFGEDVTTKPDFNVPVVTFDSLELDADLVKIDVEGGEFDVLEGMKKYLPRNIIIELHDERRELELLQKMILQGYMPRRLDEHHWWFRQR
jgi:FkbM family methyltransferase